MSAREEFERQRAAMSGNLAAHLRSVGHPLAAAIVEGDVTLGAKRPDELEREVINEDQAAGALELGDDVLVWRGPAR